MLLLHIGNMVKRLRNWGKGESFPAFRAEYTYLPICFDSAHVLYLSCTLVGKYEKWYMVGKYEKWYMVGHWPFPLLVYMI